jgi:hypothetical protein
MGHFGKFCQGDPKCGKCGGKHETHNFQEAANPTLWDTLWVPIHTTSKI